VKTILVLVCIPIVAYFVFVKGLLVDFPIEIGRHFESDDKYQRELLDRHNKRTEALVVQCIHQSADLALART
jgi:hypothetical protein